MDFSFLNTLGIILPPGSLALTVKRHHYHLSKDTALLGIQAKDWDQGKDEGHSRDRNPWGRRQEPEPPIRKGSENNPQKKAEKRKFSSLPFLNPTPAHSTLDPWLNLGIEEKRWQETGMEQGQDLIKDLSSNPDSATVWPWATSLGLNMLNCKMGRAIKQPPTRWMGGEIAWEWT